MAGGIGLGLVPGRFYIFAVENVRFPIRSYPDKLRIPLESETIDSRSERPVGFGFTQHIKGGGHSFSHCIGVGKFNLDPADVSVGQVMGGAIGFFRSGLARLGGDKGKSRHEGQRDTGQYPDKNLRAQRPVFSQCHLFRAPVV